MSVLFNVAPWGGLNCAKRDQVGAHNDLNAMRLFLLKRGEFFVTISTIYQGMTGLFSRSRH